MTWHNTPCAPTLAALSEVCPLGWAEILLVPAHRAGPKRRPARAVAFEMCTIRAVWGLRRWAGPEHEDIEARLSDLQKLAKNNVSDLNGAWFFGHVRQVRERLNVRQVADETAEDMAILGPWRVPPSDFVLLARQDGVHGFDLCWGPEQAPVYFLGHNPIYPGSA